MRAVTLTINRAVWKANWGTNWEQNPCSFYILIQTINKIDFIDYKYYCILLLLIIQHYSILRF